MVKGSCTGHPRPRMICVSEWPLPGTVIDVESGSGRRSLGGLWDCYITWIGLDLSNDLIVGGKWDTVAGKSPNLMGDGEEQRDSTRARPTPYVDPESRHVQRIRERRCVSQHLKQQQQQHMCS